MPNQTIYNNNAVSRIVYYYGQSVGDVIINDECCFKVVEYQEDLVLITDPQELDVVFIENGTYGGVDIAIYHNGGWVIKPLKGAKGDKGDKGNKGVKGDKGDAGIDGANGAPGQTGLPPDHQWVGTQLQFKKPDGSWGVLVDLKGDDGIDGVDGQDGSKGDKPNHEWQGTELRFEKPDGSWGVWVDLKGVKGDTGDKGDKPAHQWNPANPTELRFENPDGTWGTYQNLKGDAGTNGTNGLDGISIIWLGTLASFPTSPSLNNAFYHPTTKKSYVFDGASWQIMCQDGIDATSDAYYQPLSGLSVFIPLTTHNVDEVASVEVFNTTLGHSIEVEIIVLNDDVTINSNLDLTGYTVIIK